MLFERILLLSDLSDTTRFAFGPVAALLRGHPGAKVILAHAVIGTTEQFFLDATLRAAIDAKARAKAQPALSALAQALRGEGVTVEEVLEVGSPYNVLFEVAARLDVDAIVVPTRHQHSVVRRVSNSVTARAIRAHALPVMTMNQHFAERGAFAGFQRVLHPVDFGAGQRDGLDAAVDFARGLGARLDAIHVLRSFDVDSVLADDAEARAAALAGIEQTRTRAERQLADVLSRAQGIEAESHVIVADAVGEGIAAAARRLSSDCIVLPALGRDSVHTQLMGSTAEYLIAHAPCPVLFHDGKLDGLG